VDQGLVNWLLGGFGAVLGFLLHSIWQAVKDLQTADGHLADKVSQIEVLVAGQYAKREDVTALSNALFAKLDKIHDLLQQKADK